MTMAVISKKISNRNNLAAVEVFSQNLVCGVIVSDLLEILLASSVTFNKIQDGDRLPV